MFTAKHIAFTGNTLYPRLLLVIKLVLSSSYFQALPFLIFEWYLTVILQPETVTSHQLLHIQLSIFTIFTFGLARNMGEESD